MAIVSVGPIQKKSTTSAPEDFFYKIKCNDQGCIVAVCKLVDKECENLRKENC